MRAAGIRCHGATMKLLTPITLTAALAAAAGLALTVGVGSAASSGPSSFQPIVPCRLADTRPASQVGPFGAPIGPDTAVTITVHGNNGNCTIPTTAVGIATNTTAVNPTAASFLTVYPADAATRPTASNLNYVPGSPPTPNQVTVGLSADGKINVFNRFGTVDVVIDIVGYYVPAATPGPPGTASLPALHVGTRDRFAFPTGSSGFVVPAAAVDVPAGTYHVTYTLTMVNFTADSDLFRCWIGTGDTAAHGGTTSAVGPGYNVEPFNGQAKLALAGPTTLTVHCKHDNAINGDVTDKLYAENATISALAVAP